MKKIYINQGQKAFVTSDTHYGHTNIVEGETKWDKPNWIKRLFKKDRTRKFSSVQEMNDRIVNNINEMVSEDDILIHFGDFSFGGIENILEFRSQIKCKTIYLLAGNHDHHIVSNKVLIGDTKTQDLFIYCGQYEDFEVIYKSNKKGDKFERIRFVGCHFPIHSWDKCDKGRIHLHGHTHLRKPLHKVRSADVGMDGNDFKPWELKEIVSKIRNNKTGNLVIKKGHHR